MREEELRSRLQALAVAGRVDPAPATLAAVRRRVRRKVQGGVAVVLVGLLLAGVGVRLGSEAIQRRDIGPAPVIAPPSGPPAAGAPKTFVGQVGDGGSRRTAIIDARTGKILRYIPGTERQSNQVADVVVGPDLRTMYLPATSRSRAGACDAGWTQVDLATGARRPAFGGLTGVGQFSLSADGRWLALVHTTGPEILNRSRFEVRCHTEQLIVRELASGKQRVWTIPPGVSVDGLQLSPDATRLVYLLEKAPGGQRLLHVLPLAGTTSVADGHDLPAAGDCPVSMWRFLDGRRLLALGGQGCGGGHFDNLLVRFDLGIRRVMSTVPLGLPVEPFSLDVDRSGRHVIIAAAGKPNDQRPATAYVLHDGHPQRVPFRGDCWQADW